MDLVGKLEQIKQEREGKIVDALKGLNVKGVFSFVAETKQEALVKSRFYTCPKGCSFNASTTICPVCKSPLEKKATPAKYDYITKITYTTVSLGHNYQELVNRHRVKENKTPDFVAQGTYCISENNILFEYNGNNAALIGRKYLRVYPKLCQSFVTKTIYLDGDGSPMSAEQYKAWAEEFGKSWSPNKSQGLDEPIEVRNYIIDNVKYLKRGDNEIVNDITKELLSKFKSW